MFGWAKTLFGRSSKQPLVAPRDPFAIRGRFDNAQTTDENRRNWWMGDFLSAKAANSLAVRQTLRTRSRYEVSNNPYLFGVANANADDLISTGPTLQVLRKNDSENKQIERAWVEWAHEVGLTEKLRTLKLAKTVDGEGFLVLKTKRDQEHPVKLYPVDVEADQFTAALPRDIMELWIDGLVLHPVTGRPVSWDVLKTHPGDLFFPNISPLASERIKAKFVIHWFQKFRPGQVRGVPAFTTALDLFVDLRSHRKSILAKANIAAQLTAVLKTPMPADGTGQATGTPFDTVPIDRGVMTTLPGEYEMKQFESGEPATTYDKFQKSCLGEACRPIRYPLNLALGTSQDFNFSSAQLDHIDYRGSLTIERADCDTVALEKITCAWLEEAILDESVRRTGLLPRSIQSIADVPHEWHWPGYTPLDPVKDAAADHARLSNGSMTWQQFWSSRGYDWKEVMAQQKAEREEIERLGLVFGDPTKTNRTEAVGEEVADVKEVA